MQNKNNSFSMPDFKWFLGTVEDISDPEKLGRVRVRIHGYHANDEEKIKKEDLYWAQIMMNVNSASLSGMGDSPTGMKVGTTVCGFFSDETQQMPIIIGTLNGKVPKQSDLKYENKDRLYKDNEPDTNRLVRNENIDKTIVKNKKDNVVKVPTTKGKEWEEPKTPYDAEYPHNHVKETESGHITEFDDTKDKERIHEYHKAGTFYEIHPNGTKVTKIVKDNYDVILGDDYCYIKGNCKITIDGDASILVKGDSIIEVNGDKEETIKGKYSLTVNEDFDLKVNGNQNSSTAGQEKRNAKIISLN